jgi:hypothetical protein
MTKGPLSDLVRSEEILANAVKLGASHAGWKTPFELSSSPPGKKTLLQA